MKFTVTPELATLLKTLRVQNGVPSKEVAERVGKSPSYLSKLEGGVVQTIEDAQLRQMICTAAASDDFYGEALPAAARLLVGTIGSDRLIDQEWLLQFDVVERPIDVPAEMASDIERNLEELGIDAEALTALINANPDSNLPDDAPANQTVTVDHDGKKSLDMHVQVNVEEIENALAQPAGTTTYFVLYSIVRSMFRMRLFPGIAEKLPPEQTIALLRRTAEYMGHWEIHSLTGFGHFLSSDEFIAYQLPLAPEEGKLFGRAMDQLREMASFSSLQAIDRLSTFNETFEWDPGFALKIAGIPFSQLGDMSYANKSKLIAEIEELVDRYVNMDSFERKIETY